MQNKLLKNKWLTSWIGLTVVFFILYLIPVVFGSDNEHILDLIIGSLFFSSLVMFFIYYIKVVFEYWDVDNYWYRTLAVIMAGIIGIVILVLARDAYRGIISIYKTHISKT